MAALVHFLPSSDSGGGGKEEKVQSQWENLSTVRARAAPGTPKLGRVADFVLDGRKEAANTAGRRE